MYVSKIAKSDVIRILRSPRPDSYFAKMFDVSIKTIQKIRKGKSRAKVYRNYHHNNFSGKPRVYFQGRKVTEQDMFNLMATECQ